ncbi:VOC family protein [Nocardioides sp. SYSU DS0651]|uniref:VOC family protein n=1 Tax=Nocardioides sp. SYSU DS0651 TaxID=3415955 RepID=UPI003F4B0F42
MALGTYQALCIDATDVRRLGAFWAAVLGLDLEVLDRDDRVLARLTGPTPQHTVWINGVPEPVTVKQRMHLDVHARAVADVLGVGARPVDLHSFPWQLVRDPEGGELCVFERDRPPDDRLLEVVVDCPPGEHHALATWWADVLGGTVERDADDRFAWVSDIPGAPFEALVTQPVPEPKTVKNRIHLDITTDSVPALTGRGARVLRAPDGDVHWTVLADPVGNEFCAFAADPAGPAGPADPADPAGPDGAGTTGA